MQLHLAVRDVLDQLAESLCSLASEDYAQPCQTLSGNTIGQHVRHIIELFQALENGYVYGLINYEKRKRDRTIENDRDLACRLLAQIRDGLARPDKPLLLEADYAAPSTLPDLIPTNYHREIAYNLEHTVHHMALIRIGIRELGSVITLPDSYGVASSTIKYRQCAR